jgi:isopenicillin N synthase-like dioxygenase
MYVKTIDYKSSQAAQDFSTSLQETGFAVLKNHPISQPCVEAVYQDWKRFFQDDAKLEYLFDSASTRQSGYFPFKSENAKGYSTKDLKEFYHYRDLNDLPKDMAHNTQVLLEELSTLASQILDWVEAELPKDIAETLSMPLGHMLHNSDMSLVRILHYPPITDEAEEGAVRAAAHEDIDLLTILPAATAPGLQVQDKAGNWHDVPCDYGTLIFNAGDMLQLATKGYYKSTTHRVVNPVGDLARQSRYSVPLFLHPRSEIQLSHAHTAGSYLLERLREIGTSSV